MPGATFQESPRLLKFAGLGRYGRLKQAQAEQLADAGWGAPVIDWTGGFLATVFVEGRPVSGAKVDSILIETMARYLAFRRKAFPATRRRSFDEMIDMIRINISEGVGESGCDRLDRLEQCRGFFEEETPVAVDGRMLPHEWLQTPHGYLKADGIDHHDDHFFPGCQDIAWDLAGGCVEFGFGIPEERRFVEQYQSLTQDRSVRDRLAFYKVAYLAYRLGYVSLAAEALDPSPDAARFKSLFHRYRSLLVRELRLI